MEIICLASSSAGNAYLLRDERRTLLIECGLAFRELKGKLLDRNLVGAPILLSNITAALVTHAHQDHAKGAGSVAQYTTVIASRYTLDTAKVPRYAHRYPIGEWETMTANGYEITAFPVEHDCDGAYGFIIYDEESDERLLFVNDTKLLKWDFSQYRFDFIMIECNHDDSVVNHANFGHAATAHMHLDTVLDTFKKINMSSVKEIYLMHLSDGSSNEDAMLQAVHEATGKTVFTCQRDGGTKKYGN